MKLGLLGRRPLVLSGLGFAALVLTGFGSGERVFAPSSDLWPRWLAYDQFSSTKISHAAWDTVLKKYIRSGPADVNLFDYRGVTVSDRQALTSYLQKLTNVKVSTLNRSEQLAFWINLYNALTIDLVLEHYPVKSIREIDISPGLFSDGPWGKALVQVEGEGLSLNDIEHRILRPIWNDNRIHYAVNCASIGCPNLQRVAYTSENVVGLLDRGARDYVNSSRGVSVSGNKITVSKIYDWYYEDFGSSERTILEHLGVYADEQLGVELARIGDVYSSAYDWTLNAV